MKNNPVKFTTFSLVTFLPAFLIFLIPTNAFGREIIVDAGGDGDYTTITAAETASAPGDTITVEPGTYNGRVTINQSGTASLPITYSSTGATVVGGFDIIASYITVEGFNVNTQGIKTKGHYNQVLNNQISNVSSYGIEAVGRWPQYGGDIYTETTYNLIRDNTIVRAHTAGIQVMGSYNIVEGNDISHTLTEGDADGLRFFGRGHTIKENRIHDITVAEAGGAPHIDCFQTWRDAYDMLFEGNYCHLQDNGMQGTMIEQIEGTVGNLTFLRNVFAMDSTGYGPGINIKCNTTSDKVQTVKIYHNTFIRTRENGDDGGDYSIRLRDVNNADIRNNIFYDGIQPAIRTEDCTNLTQDYNLFYSPEDSLTFTMSAHDLWGDPLFTDFYSDLTLQRESPAINSGVDLGYDYINGADRGAYEYQEGDTTAPAGGSFKINNGSTATNSTSVTLNITCPTDSWTPIQVAFGNTSSPNSNWTTCSATPRAHTLTTGSGTKTVYMRFKDGGGNITANRTDTITLDTTAPSTTINSYPSSGTTSTAATFTFSSNDGGATFQCKLDSSSYATCTSPKGYSGLATGSHTFYVKAIDSVGNQDLTPAQYTWTITTATTDTTAPTGGSFKVNNGSTTTNSTSVTLNITCPTDPSTPVQVAFGNTSSPNSNWTTCSTPKTHTLTTGDGTKTVYMRFKDSAGNITGNLTDTITLDTTAPTTTISAYPSASTTSTNPSFAFSSNDGWATFQCKLDSSSYATCTSPKFYSGVVSGSHTFYVKAIDSVGNQDSTPAEYTWTINATIPDTTAPTGGSFVINNGSAITNSTSVTLNITCPTDPWTPIQVAFGNTSSPNSNWTTCSTPKTHTLSAGDGTKTVYMRFKDGGGNTTGNLTDTITLDTTAPDDVNDETESLVATYRFWSASLRGHFFTASITERDDLINNQQAVWSYEGEAWEAYANQPTGAAPVYRFWSNVYGHHFYTISETEKDEVQARYSGNGIWSYEQVGYYAYPNQVSGTMPVYRFWSPIFAGHFFTTSEVEKNDIITNKADVWTYEGVAFYVK